MIKKNQKNQKQFFFDLVFNIGKVWGWLSKLFVPPSFFYLGILFKEGYATSRQKKRFGKFGKGSKLSPNMMLIHPNYASVGKNCEFAPHVIIEMNKISKNSPILKIGNNCSFGEFTHITCCNNIMIGNGTLTGRFVLITDNAHGNSSKDEIGIPPLERTNFSRGGVKIGENVWVGDKVTILPNVEIGDNAIIGANSVVTHNIPSNVVVVGCPAKIVKYL